VTFVTVVDFDLGHGQSDRSARTEVIGAVGQTERETMLEWQRKDIAKAGREGKYKGCAPAVRRRGDEIIRLKEAGVARPRSPRAWEFVGRAFTGFWPVKRKKNEQPDAMTTHSILHCLVSWLPSA
jgi:DNA invertase Pin-like site-specific DNA recombinase